MLNFLVSQVVAAVDINTVSNEVYRHNHPATPCLQKNITGLSLPLLEKMSPELVLMSPPCQPHTRQGKQLDRQVDMISPVCSVISPCAPGPEEFST